MSQDALGQLKHLKTARARWPFPDEGGEGSGASARGCIPLEPEVSCVVQSSCCGTSGRVSELWGERPAQMRKRCPMRKGA